MDRPEPVYQFPFGQILTKVEQRDKTPKKAFVLGVYASAVHARWVDKNGKQKVSALAVASEPSIFWTGDNAEEVISSIEVPEQLGKLTVPTDKRLNGPSGRALDTHYNDTVIEQYKLPKATVPNFDKAELNSKIRREEILKELEASQADTLILLGDLPIYWFLRFYSDMRFTKLSEFGKTNDTYGKPHQLKINGKHYNVVALCHPRQADRLGSSSAKWGQLHDYWTKNASR